MVELEINGSKIELLKKGQDIKYTMQIADVFDIASVSSSYTNSFSIPKTPQNTQAFQYLGIVGDQSSIPYSKTQVSLKKDGFDLISKGWLNISETNESYKVSIINGMIDFFKAIENKTLGLDLDLSNFEHDKTMENIINSFDNEYYNYIIADYGGKSSITTFFPLERFINIDYLVPSFSVKKLLELIFSTFGYTYSSVEMDNFLDGLFITYPTPPIYETSDQDIVATLIKNYWTSTNIVQVGSVYTNITESFWDETTIIKGQLFGATYKIENSSNYRIEISIEAYARYYSPFVGYEYKGCTYQILRNGNPIFQTTTDPFSVVEGSINIYLEEGDLITTFLFVNERSYFVTRVLTPREMTLRNFSVNSINIEIFEFTNDDVILKDAFKDLKIKDFFKELLYRTGLTPITDGYSNHITFLPISNRIDTNNAIDWSDKYVRRVKETYIKNSYAQRNLFKMKYNDGTENKNDGLITVNNANIEDEKVLVQSVFYSPDDGIFNFRGVGSASQNTPILPMFSKTPKTGEDGAIEIEYKELDNRFYLLRRNTRTNAIWKLKSEIIPNEEIVNQLHFASIERTLLGSLVEENFKEYSKIFNNFRAHNIELALGLSDYLSLDMTRPYYFSQEGGYYILNSLPYKDGETTIGEFVRINQ